MKRLSIYLLCVGVAVMALPSQAQQRLKELASIQGVRSNQLVGYGVVVGLDGSGDSSTLTSQSLTAMLTQLGVQIPPGTSLSAKNAAPVSVTASLPAFARPGQPIDVTVSSIGSSKSLRGGTLLMTPLRGADGQIYAIAQGNILLGGAGASAAGSSAQVNQLNAGRIPAGATVERAVPTNLGQGDFIHVELQQSDFTTANRVVNEINSKFGSDTARAIDGRQIQVRAPQDSNERVQFLARLENLAVDPAENAARVVINARTGSVVMNQAVTIEPCAVSHGNLSVSIGARNDVSQPNPLSGGQTTPVQNADIAIKSDQGRVLQLAKSAKLADVVKALNSIGATPQDLLSILQAMKAAGALKAELEII
ncbi:flagellar basal body P-ring protein FlgI [Chitinivorax sp. B]|uniref:flagellar basal body P-ring protein FlgI n=1 Tax=Chitinivorax sp. B TaxID=2502235 RepID=UPI0010F455A3|nr:flagellar basal body P-ring protein FlgI [Chitinivorax sp. B]